MAILASSNNHGIMEEKEELIASAEVVVHENPSTRKKSIKLRLQRRLKRKEKQQKKQPQQAQLIRTKVIVDEPRTAAGSTTSASGLRAEESSYELLQLPPQKPSSSSSSTTTATTTNNNKNKKKKNKKMGKFRKFVSRWSLSKKKSAATGTASKSSSTQFDDPNSHASLSLVPYTDPEALRNLPLLDRDRSGGTSNLSDNGDHDDVTVSHYHHGNGTRSDMSTTGDSTVVVSNRTGVVTRMLCHSLSTFLQNDHTTLRDVKMWRNAASDLLLLS